MKILVALLAMTAACVLSPSGASAQTYPVCIRGCDFGNGDCSYSSYQQCLASAAGRTAWCEANPDYRPVSDGQTGRVKISRRKL